MSLKEQHKPVLCLGADSHNYLQFHLLSSVFSWHTFLIDYECTGYTNFINIIENLSMCI